jgi:teichuronic acid biosynthesis glycosyltransferase TuaG
VLHAVMRRTTNVGQHGGGGMNEDIDKGSGSECSDAAPQVSIVTPVFNAQPFLEDVRQSVLAQDFEDWEWQLVDDGSEDGSIELIETWTSSDPRIHLIRTPENVGAGVARNLGMQASRGRYIAFLDADDMWRPGKLSRQVGSMAANNTYFTYTGFHYMPETGGDSGVVAIPPRVMTYGRALKNTTILTSTVMIDRTRVPQHLLAFPNVRRGQDTALWWRLLRTVGSAHGLPEVLTSYRQNPGSLSANRLRALKRTWALYRTQENLSLPVATWYFCHYIANAVMRRRGRISVRKSR